MKKNKNYVGQGILAGFISGLIFDLIHYIKTIPDICTQTPFQKFLGFECVRMGNLYFMAIWLAIIGGYLGYKWKKNAS